MSKKEFVQLDPLLHSQLRLSIISILISEQEADFNNIIEVTQATRGNVSVQIKKLEEAGYITVKKSFKNNYQHTSLKITKKGLNAFEKYVKGIQAYLNPK